jgi:hypothetical protein
MRDSQPNQVALNADISQSDTSLRVKKSYSAPELNSHGTLQEKTLNNTNSGSDGSNYS